MTKRCKAAFAATVNGVPKVMRPGQLVQDDDPVMKGREHLFEDIEEYMHRQSPQVEEATAEPGARRSLRLPRKQAAKKAAAKKPAAKKTTAPPEEATGGQGDTSPPEQMSETPTTDEGNTEGTGGE